jgi:transposase
MTPDATQNFQLLPDEVLDTFPDPIRTYVLHLHTVIRQQQEQIRQQQEQIQRQQKEIQLLKTRVTELEGRLAKNSSNSSKPPGSDGLNKKTKSMRDKSDKKQGAQQGHAGKGRSQVKNPDVVVNHAPTSCVGCGFKLDQVDGTCVEKRQVFEIPQPKIEVTEHRTEEKQCPCCGVRNRGSFPEDVKGPVQFGARIQALTTYFAHQHFIPVDRICEIFEDIFDVSISPGTCSNYSEKLFLQLEVFERDLKTHLLAARVLHFDETGMRCEKKLRWIHVASSPAATLYTIHAKRGQEAMDEAGILPNFTGRGVHDHWFPYFSYQQVLHGLCNAHHLRELTYIHEVKEEEWAKHMKDTLIWANEQVKKYASQGALPPEIILQIEKTYGKIIDEGLTYHESLPPLPKSKRGKQKQRDGKNLLDRLQEKRECVLRFIYDFSVPFTNNQGEQDIRMVKLKQKISGSFRTFYGGQIFCRIRSYISTARKQGWSIWGALSDAIKGAPHLLPGNELAELSAAV